MVSAQTGGLITAKCKTVGLATVSFLCLMYSRGIMMLIGFAIGVSMVSATSDRIDSIVRGEMAKRNIPGAQVAVVRSGRVVYAKSFGKCSLQFDLPVKNSTLFTLNSATKPFTGVAIMQLVEKGLLNLEDPIGKHLSGLPEAWRGVTIRQLATHVSGLPDIVDQKIGKLVGDLPDEEAWAKVQTMPMEFPTNTKYSYNQTNYLLLGRLIDKLSGQPFVRFIQANQFQVVGMKNTAYGDARDVVPRLTQTYRLDEVDGKVIHRPVGSEFPHFLWTAAGLCASAEDVAKWAASLMSRKLLQSGSLREMWRLGTLADGRQASWVVGWPAAQRAAHRWVAGIGGGRSAFFVYPEDDLAVVLLTNLAGASPEEWIEQISREYISTIPVPAP